jgi:hypothetical protein
LLLANRSEKILSIKNPARSAGFLFPSTSSD